MYGVYEPWVSGQEMSAVQMDVDTMIGEYKRLCMENSVPAPWTASEETLRGLCGPANTSQAAPMPIPNASPEIYIWSDSSLQGKKGDKSNRTPLGDFKGISESTFYSELLRDRGADEPNHLTVHAGGHLADVKAWLLKLAEQKSWDLDGNRRSIKATVIVI